MESQQQLHDRCAHARSLRFAKAPSKTTQITALLQAGGKTARQIAAAVGCTVTMVNKVAAQTGLSPVRGIKEPEAPPPRPEHAIRADLAQQLVRIQARWEMWCRP